MKPTIRLLSLLIALTFILMPMDVVHAQGPGPGGGRVLFGTNFTLESGETFDGALVLFGGNVLIEENATLNGDLVVIGGNVQSYGRLNGDVVVVGGQIHLEASAVVAGDVITIGGQLQREEGARIEGELVNNAAPAIEIPGTEVPVPDAPSLPVPAVINVEFNPFLEFTRVFAGSLLMAMLGVLATLFFHDRLDRVSQAVVTQPLIASSIGLLAIVALVVLAVTLILLPFALLGLIPLAFAWLFGVVAIGREIGERFARALRQEWAPIFTTGLGTFVLTFLVSSIQAMNDLMPFLICITWIPPLLVALLAIGGVVMTRFGARSVQSPTMSAFHPPENPSVGQTPPASTS